MEAQAGRVQFPSSCVPWTSKHSGAGTTEAESRAVQLCGVPLARNVPRPDKRSSPEQLPQRKIRQVHPTF